MTPARRLLVAGTGRSGTAYIHQLFDALGVDSSHEGIYGPRGPERWPADRLVESSWLSVPYLGDLPTQTVVVHQVRNPIKVGRSFLGRTFFKRKDAATPYSRFVREHEPSVFEAKDARHRFIRYYVAWNLRVERHAAFRYAVEDVDEDLVERLLALLGIERPRSEIQAALDVTSRTANTGPSGLPFEWHELPVVRASHDFLRLAQRYGYATY